MSEDSGQCAAFQQISLSVLHLFNVSNSNGDNIRFIRSFITWDNMFINFVRQEQLCKCLSVVTIESAEGFTGRNPDFCGESGKPTRRK